MARSRRSTRKSTATAPKYTDTSPEASETEAPKANDKKTTRRKRARNEDEDEDENEDKDEDGAIAAEEYVARDRHQPAMLTVSLQLTTP